MATADGEVEVEDVEMLGREAAMGFRGGAGAANEVGFGGGEGAKGFATLEGGAVQLPEGIAVGRRDGGRGGGLVTLLGVLLKSMEGDGEERERRGGAEERKGERKVGQRG